MQEEVENRTVNLAISMTKLTGRTIIAGIRKYLQHREKVKMKKARDPAVHGKQSVKQLLGQNQGATNVEIDKESIVVVKHFCNISFEKFTMYVLLQMASSNHYTNGDGYDYTIRTHIS